MNANNETLVCARCGSTEFYCLGNAGKRLVRAGIYEQLIGYQCCKCGEVTHK